MDADAKCVIEAFFQRSLKCVLALAGCGGGAVAMLQSVPGASAALLEIAMPYAPNAVTEFLGYKPQSFCSVATSQSLALRSWNRACLLAPRDAVIGIGCTATLATNRLKKGEHRVHLCARTSDSRTTWSLVLQKGGRKREEEQALVDLLILNVLAQAAGLPNQLPVPLLPGEQLQSQEEKVSDAITRLFRGELTHICIGPDGRVAENAEPPAMVLPGAFNPVHAGHWGLAKAAHLIKKIPVAFELSIQNADKGALGVHELRSRLGQFTWRAPVWLTRAATFVEKARLFPGVTFVIGQDTAQRLISPQYYDGNVAGVHDALAFIRSQGCHFLVACRAECAGGSTAMKQGQVPAAFNDLFKWIPESIFRLDLSSTQIRERKGSK